MKYSENPDLEHRNIWNKLDTVTKNTKSIAAFKSLIKMR